MHLHEKATNTYGILIMKKVLTYEYSPQELTELIQNAVRDVLADFSLAHPVANNSPPLADPEVLSSKEVCAMLGISAPTLIKYRKEGKISGKRIGGKIFYIKSNIEKLLK